MADSTEENLVLGLLSPHNILRLTTIIGGYILIRPLIEMSFRRLFSTGSSPSPQLSPQQPISALLGKTLAEESILSSSSPTNATAVATSSFGEWGDGARHRQAKFLEYWEAERSQRAEEEDLEDIKDLLED